MVVQCSRNGGGFSTCSSSASAWQEGDYRVGPALAGAVRRRALRNHPSGVRNEKWGAKNLGAPKCPRSKTLSGPALEEAPGRYARRAVTVGSERGGRIIVTEGLQPGQRVVVDGTLLLDKVLEEGS